METKKLIKMVANRNITAQNVLLLSDYSTFFIAQFFFNLRYAFAKGYGSQLLFYPFVSAITSYTS